MASPACCRTQYLVMETISDAISKSRIRLSAATRFSRYAADAARLYSRRFWTAPN